MSLTAEQLLEIASQYRDTTKEYARTKSTVRFAPLPPHMEAVASFIAARLEAVFGVTALPQALAMTPVPLFIEGKEPPETTLFDALFTDTPEIVP